MPSTSLRFRRVITTTLTVVMLAAGQPIGASIVSAADAPKAVAAKSAAMVTIDNFTFGPKVLTVKAGTTVTWVNGDDIPHSIVDKTRKVFRSKVLDTDDSFSFTFMEPGTYDYFCGLHPHMTAQIIVTR